jgi:hypothetical protein
MKKFGYVIATLAAIAFALPSIASAETVVVKHGGHHEHMGMGMHRDHGWHGHHERTVIIKHGHRGY